MKFKNLIRKLFEENPDAEEEVFIELYTDTDEYEKIYIPISNVDKEYNSGEWLEPKPICATEKLILSANVNKAFFNIWQKRKWSPVNIEGEIENHFSIKKKVKLIIPKEVKS